MKLYVWRHVDIKKCTTTFKDMITMDLLGVTRLEHLP
jgi:hypothetical protein